MLTIDKPRGLTPLQALERLREIKPDLHGVKLAYAGRLDPQAEGLLLVLVDDECKQRDQFQQLDKIYEFDLLIGIGTDTSDIMGIPTIGADLNVSHRDIEQVINKFTGKISQSYPAYSSKTVKGVPMYKLARQGELPLVNHQVEVFDLKIIDENAYDSRQLQEFIHKNIRHVTGDFRQAEILNAWNLLLANKLEATWTVFKLWAHVSSGTYIRQLCADIGNELGTKGLALSISRQQVGDFNISNAMKI